MKIETVDSFQGKQMDVVILSCVRAGGHRQSGGGTPAVPAEAAGAAAGTGAGTKAGTGSSGQVVPARGVGFLADTRRMNVAITRAKQGMWILGNKATLHADPTWQALFQDAADRGSLVSNASASTCFPPGCPLGGVQQQQQRQGGNPGQDGAGEAAGGAEKGRGGGEAGSKQGTIGVKRNLSDVEDAAGNEASGGEELGGEGSGDEGGDWLQLERQRQIKEQEARLAAVHQGQPQAGGTDQQQQKKQKQGDAGETAGSIGGVEGGAAGGGKGAGDGGAAPGGRSSSGEDGGGAPGAPAAAAGVHIETYTNTLSLLVQLLQPAVTWHIQQIHAKLTAKHQQLQQQQPQLQSHQIVVTSNAAGLPGVPLTAVPRLPMQAAVSGGPAVVTGGQGHMGGSGGGQLLLQPLKEPEGGLLPPAGAVAGPGGLTMYAPPGAVRAQAGAVAVGADGVPMQPGMQVLQPQHMMGVAQRLQPPGMQVLLQPQLQLLAPGPGVAPEALHQQQQQPGRPGHQQGGGGLGGQGGGGAQGRGGGHRPMTRKDGRGGGGGGGHAGGRKESPQKQRGGHGGGRRGGDGKGKRGGRQG